MLYVPVNSYGHVGMGLVPKIKGHPKSALPTVQVRNPTIWVPEQVKTNQAVQSRKVAENFRFRKMH